MAWQVAVLLDSETHAGSYLGIMPTWAKSTPNRQSVAPQLRTDWDSMWAPEPTLTLFTCQHSDDLIGELLTQIPIIQDHFTGLTCLRLIGVEESPLLTASMATFGYQPVIGHTYDGLGFARLLEEIDNLPELTLDANDWANGATDWQVLNRFYDSLFAAIGAPDWHGRNFNALDHSIEGGAINKIEVPYRIVVLNSRNNNEAVQVVLRDFSALIQHIQSNGCPIELLLAD